MTWLHNNEEITSLPSGVVGFVYLIKNHDTGRMYIGKKSATHKIRRPPLKGYKRARLDVKDSGWQRYYGSCDELKADVKELGQDRFGREILHFCYSKKEMTYFEVKEQFARGVIESDLYYNSSILGKFHAQDISDNNLN